MTERANRPIRLAHHEVTAGPPVVAVLFSARFPPVYPPPDFSTNFPLFFSRVLLSSSLVGGQPARPHPQPRTSMNRTKNAFPRRAAALALLLLPIAAPLFAAEPVDFSCKPMLAGRAALAGEGFYAPYSEWEAVPAGGDPSKSKDWTVSGRRGKKGWRFVYRGGAISRIAAPSGGEVAFERAIEGFVPNPPLPPDVAICDLQSSSSSLFSWNMKLPGKRLMLRLTCSFSLRVATPYSSARSRSSRT